tara:strand:+ start:361 stop:1431 length:1071 start_codon:yes stop_codon:yes gene_type:complete
MSIINILDNDTVKVFIVLFIILQCANLIKLPDTLTDTELKKNIYNLVLILLIIYYCNSQNMNNITIGVCILITVLVFKNLCSKNNNNNNLLTGGENNVDDNYLVNIQKEVLEDETETYESDNEEYDAYGGNEDSNKTMKNIDKELNSVYKEYLKEQKEADNKKEEFKDKLVKNKMAHNIKKIEETNKMDESLKKLEKLEEKYKKISTLMEGGKDLNIGGVDFSKEVARIDEIRKSVNKNKKLYDLNKDGKLDMNDMPDEAQIEQYKAEIDKVMDEEGDLFNLSEDSPVLEEWSEAFKNNFKMQKISNDKKKVGGAYEKITPAYDLNDIKGGDERLKELVGGYNEMSSLYAKIQSFK